MVMDRLSERFAASFRPGKGEYVITSHAGLVLVKPLTYMNNSGSAVAEVLDELDVPVSSLVVVVDDVALPLGTLRIRQQGSDGGHNGLYSIIYHLQTHEFTRIRCGIRPEVGPGKSEMTGFVLSPFEPAELPTVRQMVGRAADAVVSLLETGIQHTMTRFNTH